jgi:Ribbon-helix-helix protein, copG family
MRHVRVSDELWEASLEAVKWRGDPSLSHIIRRALAQYVAGTQRKKEAGEQPGSPNRGANNARRRQRDG